MKNAEKKWYETNRRRLKQDTRIDRLTYQSHVEDSDSITPKENKKYTEVHIKELRKYSQEMLSVYGRNKIRGNDVVWFYHSLKIAQNKNLDESDDW